MENAKTRDAAAAETAAPAKRPAAEAPAAKRPARKTAARRPAAKPKAAKPAAGAQPEAKPATARRKPLTAGPEDKALWGLKHVCPDCASRYYDLKKASAKCPSCGADAPQAKLPVSGHPVRRTRSSFGRYR